MINWSSDLIFSHNLIAEEFLDFIHDHNLFQHVYSPTRYSTSDNILDLVFSCNPNFVSNVNILPGIGDHEMVSFEVCVKYPKLKKFSKEIYCFNTVNLNLLSEECMKSKLNTCIDKIHCINEAWNIWKEEIFTLVDLHIPKKHVKINYKYPWLNNNLKKMFRKQKRLHRLYCKRKTLNAKLNLYQSRKELRKVSKISESQYIKQLSQNLDKGKKQFWKFVKQQQTSSTGISSLKLDGRTYVSDKEKADLLNKEFQKYFTIENKNDLPSLSSSFIPEMCNITVQVDEVYNLLCNIKTSKATKQNDVMPKVLKACAAALSPSLTKLFNLSITQGQIPAEWKDAVITPLYKKASRTDPKNYRPVSLTSIICKLLEKLSANGS